jgi:hypothetical protein
MTVYCVCVYHGRLLKMVGSVRLAQELIHATVIDEEPVVHIEEAHHVEIIVDLDSSEFGCPGMMQNGIGEPISEEMELDMENCIASWTWMTPVRR